MLDTNKIEKLRTEKMTQEQLCKKLDLSIAGYQRMIKRNDFKVKTLQKIADILNVDIQFFFSNKLKYQEYQQNVSEPSAEYGIKKENELLKKRIEDLERIIELMGKTNK